MGAIFLPKSNKDFMGPAHGIPVLCSKAFMAFDGFFMFSDVFLAQISSVEWFHHRSPTGGRFNYYRINGFPRLLLHQNDVDIHFYSFQRSAHHGKGCQATCFLGTKGWTATHCEIILSRFWSIFFVRVTLRLWWIKDANWFRKAPKQDETWRRHPSFHMS